MKQLRVQKEMDRIVEGNRFNSNIQMNRQDPPIDERIPEGEV